MKKLLLVLILVSLFPVALGQNRQKQSRSSTNSVAYEANVSTDEATFVFPVLPRRQWLWDGEEWFGGILQYTWHIELNGGRQNLQAGYFYYTDAGTGTRTEEDLRYKRGSLRQLLQAGQYSLFRDGSVVKGVNVQGFVSDRQDKITIRIVGTNPIRLLFSNRPRFLTFKSKILRNTISQRVVVNYK